MTSLKRPLAGQSSGISSKVYIRSTKNGRAQKIVRELYLREDIPCLSKLCTLCASLHSSDAAGSPLGPVLSEAPPPTSEYPNGHYLIPDTNVLLNAMDLLEQKDAFFDVIILQTVLEELRNRSIPLYSRLIGLFNGSEKRFCVFFNEFRQETCIKRQQGETINDRNDRAVRVATSWYGKHLQESLAKARKTTKPPSVIMLTDDRDNLRKAGLENVNASSMATYLEHLPNNTKLMDMLAQTKSTRSQVRNPGELFYDDYYTASKINTGLKAGTLHQGSFSVSTYNYLEAMVHVSAFERPMIILGRDNSNRAVHGDQVIIEILPKKEWKSPSSTLVDEETLAKNDNPEAENGELIVTERERKALQAEVKKAHSKSSEDRSQPTARVVGIVRRNWRQYVGHVEASNSGAGDSRVQQTVFVKPMDKKIPRIRIRTRQAHELVGQRILVTIDAWERDSKYPIGHFVKSLGEIESKGAETEALLLEYDVQYRPFPQVVLDCLPEEGHDWRVPSDNNDPGWRQRRDLRDLLICSIDPVGCQDIDDALHARPLPNGNFEVGVHIADVSHFVRPGNAMDTEASLRGTTVYLVDKRIDMLPMLLGTDLCSLKPYVERYAFSAIWELTPDADVVTVDFTKSVIRSREAFSYEQAQLRIDDPSQTDDLTTGMRTLLTLSQKLRQKRMDAGALNLASPEVRVEAESETSDPMDVKTKEHIPTNSLVEEFMLLANISVAKKNFEMYPQSALLRRHSSPPKTNFEELTNQLKLKKNMVLDSSSSKALATSLDTCVDPNEPFFNTLVRILATRCMMSAEYFISGTTSEPEFRHYGLASPIYTHFTSPIRRYADLVAHRQLAASIGYEPLPLELHNRTKLNGVCKNINVRHRNAQFAGRASVEYYVSQALKGRVIEEEGFVMRVFNNGITVFIPRFGIEGTLRLKDLGLVFEQARSASKAQTDQISASSFDVAEPLAEFDEANYLLTIRSSASEPPISLEIFAKVRVRIRDEKDESSGKRKLKMELLKGLP